MTPRLTPDEQAAVRRIVELLAPLPIADRRRVLAAVAILLGHELVALSLIVQSLQSREPP
jgi:hypothetical protein